MEIFGLHKREFFLHLDFNKTYLKIDSANIYTTLTAPFSPNFEFKLLKKTATLHQLQICSPKKDESVFVSLRYAPRYEVEKTDAYCPICLIYSLIQAESEMCHRNTSVACFLRAACFKNRTGFARAKSFDTQKFTDRRLQHTRESTYMKLSVF